jgi:hypothetical protein
MDDQERAQILREAREVAGSPRERKPTGEELYDQRERQRAANRAWAGEPGLPKQEREQVYKWLRSGEPQEPEPQPSVQQAPRWWDLIDERIEQRVAEERRFILEQVGEFLHEHFVKRGEETSSLKADDIRALRIDIAALKSSFADWRAANAAAKDEPHPARSVN